MLTDANPRGALSDPALPGHHPLVKITINLDEDLLREAAAIHPSKSINAVLELGLRELIYADQRKTLAAAFGSQPDLQPAPRRRLSSDQPRNKE